MITLGIIDLILIVLFVFMLYLVLQRRRLGISILILVLLIAVLLERLIPGVLASLGNIIRGIDLLNAAGPHLSFQPIIRFQ